MKFSDSYKLVWMIAGHEASQLKSRQIDPEHFFLGILKFAELDAIVIADLARYSHYDPVLLAREQALLQAFLTTLPVTVPEKTREVRYCLRRMLTHPPDGRAPDVLHRSPRTLKLPDQMDHYYLDGPRETVSATDLLKLLLFSPPPALEAALATARVLDATVGFMDDLNRFGHDRIDEMLHRTADQKPDPGSIHDIPAGTLLVSQFEKTPGQPVLLINTTPNPAAEIMDRLALHYASGIRNGTATIQRVYVFDFTRAADLPDTARSVLQGAGHSGPAILHFNARQIQALAETATDLSWMALPPGSPPVHIVAETSEAVYEQMRQAKSPLVENSRCIWLHHLDNHQLTDPMYV